MIPRVATYRLQLREGMTLDRAREVVVPHAHRLGASHLYLSPPFTAAPGSTHGYDVADHGAIEPALGGREALERLGEALRARGMGLMLDIVPNHMAAHPANPWWRDVCEWGERARHARHFDIDWSEPLTLPVLGRPFGEALEAGEIALRADPEGRGLELAYYDNAYPLAPASYRMVADALGGGLGALASAAEAARPEDPAALHAAMGEALARAGGAAGALEGAGRDLLARVHEAQAYRLTHWVEARRHLSYRRFFEVTGLVGVRVEDEAVFADVHRLILELVREGVVDGLRIDHVDGLRDPAAYLHRLHEAAPDAWIVVEKITEGHETLPPEWPVEGTTGYELIAAVDDLLVDPRGLEALETAYAELAQADAPPPEEARDAIKRRTVTHAFEGELRGVARALAPHLEAEPADLAAALAEIVVALPVYRTYGDEGGFRPDDVALLRGALEAAAPRVEAAEAMRVLEALGRPEAWEARARFQQLSGPAMAKAVEDTLFYRWNVLIARNEVGCDPLEPPGGPGAVHAALERRVAWPHALSATATHDTKRGEGARARLYALSEAPAAWTRLFEARSGGGEVEAELRWLMLQAMAGAWPPEGASALRGRFAEYLVKALREAKRETSWTEPDEAFEGRALRWAEDRLSDPAFAAGFEAAIAPWVEAGRVAGLAQTLLKVAAPGVPDVYQGTEAEDLSLVDPDNRRPPDFDRLSDLIAEGPAQQGAGPDRRHALVLARALRARAERPALFSGGAYRALTVPGALAFERSHEGERAVAVMPARPLALVADGAGFWGEARLEEARGLVSRLPDAPGPAPLGVAEMLGPLPVALLTSWEPGAA